METKGVRVRVVITEVRVTDSLLYVQAVSSIIYGNFDH